jgi:hypothetical protein
VIQEVSLEPGYLDIIRSRLAGAIEEDVKMRYAAVTAHAVKV